MKAEHCWRMSKHAQLVRSAMPSLCCSSTPVPGKWKSGDSVPKMMQSISETSTSASARALWLRRPAGAGEVEVGRQRAEDDAVNLGAVALGVGERAPRGEQRQVAGGSGAVVGDVAARLDAGALLDPGIVGLELLGLLSDVAVVEERKLVVVDDAVRDVAPQPQDLRANHMTWI